MKAIIYILILLTASTIALSQLVGYDKKTSTKGNIELTLSNNCMAGLNFSLGESGFIWPRGSSAQYIYGGGFIITHLLDDTTLIAETSYNPRNASSVFVPGSVNDGLNYVSELDDKYKVFSSLDFNLQTGENNNNSSSQRWPIWYSNEYVGAYYGEYKVDENERSQNYNKLAVFSDEDMVVISKDTDKKRYNVYDNPSLYPIGIEAETRVYNYDSEEQKDMVIINWIVRNITEKKLENLTFSPIFDVDIATIKYAAHGIYNDIMIYTEGKSYISFSTKMDSYEKDEEFGFISFKFVQLPLVNGFNEIDYENKNNRNLKLDRVAQLPDLISIYSDEFKKLFNSPKEIEKETNQIFYMKTEEFTLAPNQSASFVLQINMTPPNANYPEMDEDTRTKIEAELEANEIFFKERLTSVEVAEELTPISVFPNPTTDGNISVELGLPIGEQMTIKLFDLTGNTLGTLYQGMHHTQNYELKIGKRTTGTYLLRFTVGDKSYAKKFVVGG